MSQSPDLGAAPHPPLRGTFSPQTAGRRGGVRPVPDFSPRMLALFLEARIVSAMVWHGLERNAAGKGLRRGLAPVARVRQRDIAAAQRGKLFDAAKRVLIWGGLGLVPGDHGVMLTDDGKQEVVR